MDLPPETHPESRVFSHVSAFDYFSNCSIDDANDPSVICLEMLEGLVVWEASCLIFVAEGVPAFIIHPLAALAIAGLGFFVVVVMVFLLVCSLFVLLS